MFIHFSLPPGSIFQENDSLIYGTHEVRQLLHNRKRKSIAPLFSLEAMCSYLELSHNN